MARIIIDPVTRIEGHLRIEVDTDAEGRIVDATSSGTSFRGIELILKGRDPREAWAITQRFCGVCTVSNSIAAVRAVEHALSYAIPLNAQIIRNLMMATQFVHDHVMHFYHLHSMDWVDVVSALSADPAKAAALQSCLSTWPNNTTEYFAAVQAKLKGFVEGGRLGIFANAYWGHPAYKLPPEVNLMVFAHYLEALAWQREVIKVHAIFGGKNPHPHFAVGGVPCAIYTGSKSAVEARVSVNMDNLAVVKTLIAQMRDFVTNVYLPDSMAIAAAYKEWATPGHGEGLGNFLTYGEFPQVADTNDATKLFVPRGAVLSRELKTVYPVDLEAVGEIEEFVNNSWYEATQGKDVGLHPYDGETRPSYSGPKPPFTSIFDGQAGTNPAYSWLKSPRWNGRPMEVGPLARVLMMYATGQTAMKTLVDQSLAKLKLPLASMYSTMGRTLARAFETKVLADVMDGWHTQLMNNVKSGNRTTHNAAMWNPETWPATARGVGFQEAPRGALAHWVSIDGGKIANYQAVIPTTWNAGPKDPAGQPGPYEAALVGHKLADPSQPLEILRTIHSYDPCLACAVHVADPDGQELVAVRIV